MSQHPTDGHRDLTLEEEVALAQRALESGEPRHSAHHLANALSLGSAGLETRDLVNRLANAVTDPLSLVPTEGGLTAGAAVLRSRFLERLDRFDESIVLLLRAHGAEPNADHLAQLDAWLAAPERIDALDLDALSADLKPLLDSVAAARKLLPFIELVCERRELTMWMGFCASKLFRTAGESAKGLRISEQQAERTPSYWSMISLGSALRDVGQNEKAIEAFERALAIDPADAAPHLDIADIHLEDNRYELAARSYAAAIEIEPWNAWGLASLAYARFKLNREARDLDELTTFALGSPPGGRARTLLQNAAPFRFSIAPPSSSLIQGVRGCHEQGVTPTRSAVSSMEAPSAVLACRMFVASRGLAPDSFEITFGQVPTPDPRKPDAPTRTTLWTYGETGLRGKLFGRLVEHARPAVGPPARRVADALAELASADYEIDHWSERAVTIAKDLGQEALDGVLAAMVHPPERPNGITPWGWLFQVQVAAALVASKTGSGWRNAPRRQALFDLLHGPVDWTTSAAIIAACNLARTEPDLAADVRDLLRPLLDKPISPIQWANVVEVLHPCLEWIPGGDLRFSEWSIAVRKELDGS